MYNHFLYLLYWVLGSLVLYLGGTLRPDEVVLGNHRFNSTEAAIYAGFWATFIIWAMWDFITARGLKLENLPVALVFFWGANSIALWLVARFAHIIGFGISSYHWALILGGVASISQIIVWKGFTARRKRSRI